MQVKRLILKVIPSGMHLMTSTCDIPCFCIRSPSHFCPPLEGEGESHARVRMRYRCLYLWAAAVAFMSVSSPVLISIRVAANDEDEEVDEENEEELDASAYLHPLHSLHSPQPPRTHLCLSIGSPSPCSIHVRPPLYGDGALHARVRVRV